jgi:formylglycine-generating enzyme required for sulfatase activity
VLDSTKHGYRLPSYAEWEFAARGGNPLAPEWSYPYAGSTVLNDVAWYGANAGNAPNPVGGKLPNTLGLYDMTGNVPELIHEFQIKNINHCATLALGGDYATAEAKSGICARLGIAQMCGNAANPSKKAGFRVAGPASIGVSP